MALQGSGGFGRVAGLLLGVSVVVFAASVGVQAQQGVQKTGEAPKGQKNPGAIGNMSGQVPAQHRSAMKARTDTVTQTGAQQADWWDADSGRTMFAAKTYPNPNGELGTLNKDGPFETKGHPFFSALGTNGRACVTCHQPSDGMSISAATVRQRWMVTGGKDPLFAAVDGSNCPSLPQRLRASHSLLLDHGLFRIFLPWPPKSADGKAFKPEFSIEVVRDPTGCNTDPKYGLKAATPMISVFRRPRVVANMKFVVNEFGERGQPGFNIKTGMPLATNPETGGAVTMQLMADARDPTLRTQATDAVLNHLQGKTPPTKEQLDRIVAFESQIFAAQQVGPRRVSLIANDAPSGLSPRAMANAYPGLLGDFSNTPVFQLFDQWKGKPGAKPADATAAFKQSVARGADIYMFRNFWIRDATHLNTIGLGNPIKRTCATCHNAQMTGMDAAPGWMDIGTNNKPYADPLNDLPLFKVTCDADAPPHPFLGRVIFTHDPGRALITGRCIDVGSITMQQLRGLSGRAPYFANGSAKDIGALVDYYDRRFKINYSKQERQDLINFLSVL